MGLTGASLNRFREKVDVVLDDAFPAELVIAGYSINASGVGGKTMTEMINTGESQNFRFPFRILTASLLAPLQVGDSLEWKISVERSIPLEVIEISERPHEARIAIVCRKRRL